MSNFLNESRSSQSDEDLIRNAVRGNKEAFGELVRRYEKKVYNLAYSVLLNRDDAMDITQEAFIKAYEGLGGYKGGSQFFTWLYRIVVNLCIDFTRKEKAKTEIEYIDAIDPGDTHALLIGEQQTPEEAVSGMEKIRALKEALNSLPAEQRIAITLREIEGLSYEEIAESMDCSIGTVMSRIHYARKKLREKLKDYL